jgi:DNA-binding Xre family transcriptional regulator
MTAKQRREEEMARIINKVRQLRLEYAMKTGRAVEQKEIAEAVGVHKNTLSRIEQGKVSGIDFDTLIKLCVYYSRALDRLVGVNDLLEFDPNNRQGLEPIAA